MSTKLDEKAGMIEKIIEEKLIGPKDVVYSFVNADDLSPISKETFIEGERTGFEPLKDFPVTEEWLLYEDSQAITGDYLDALSLKTLVTGSEHSFYMAKRMFEVSYWNYEIGKEVEQGFLPKPHGLKCSRQYSGDSQCPYYYGLTRYLECAGQADKKRVTEIIASVADYWIRHRHHSPLTHWDMGTIDFETDRYYPGQWPLLFLPLYRLAWELTGEKKYMIEFERLVSKKLKPDISVMELKKLSAQWRWPVQLSHLMEIDSERKELWKSLMERWKTVWIDLRSPYLPMDCTPGPMPKKNVWKLILLAYWTNDENLLQRVKEIMEETEIKDLKYRVSENEYTWLWQEAMDWWYRVIHVVALSEWLAAYWFGRKYNLF